MSQSLLPTTIDHASWISALSGHVATGPDGQRVWARTRDTHAGLAHGRPTAAIEFHAPECIGYARLRLRRDPVAGFVVVIRTLHLQRAARRLGVGGSIVASWAERLRAIGIGELQFEAVCEGHFTSGRLFWARDGVLFKDADEPYRLLRLFAESSDADPSALRELRRRIDSGALSTPADLYRDPWGRRALAAGDWSGRWPLAPYGSRGTTRIAATSSPERVFG
jgi:hypothetical protein